MQNPFAKGSIKSQFTYGLKVVGISATRTHCVFSWMRYDASEMKKSIFDAMLCLGTIGKVSEVG